MFDHIFEKQPLLDLACKPSNFILFFGLLSHAFRDSMSKHEHTHTHTHKEKLPFCSSDFSNNLDKKFIGRKLLKPVGVS
jgi:hypothetical protein